MPVISLEVNVPEFTEDELRDAILEACVERVLGQGWEWRQDYPDESPTRVKKAEPGWFVEEMRKAARESILRNVEEVVTRAVEPLVQETLDHPYVIVDRWGDKKAEYTSLRAQIAKVGVDYLTARVGSNGETVTGYSAEGKPSRLAYFVNQMVADVYKKDLAAMVAESAKSVRADLADKVTASVAEAVRGLLNLEKGR